MSGRPKSLIVPSRAMGATAPQDVRPRARRGGGRGDLEVGPRAVRGDVGGEEERRRKAEPEGGASGLRAPPSRGRCARPAGPWPGRGTTRGRSPRPRGSSGRRRAPRPARGATGPGRRAPAARLPSAPRAASGFARARRPRPAPRRGGSTACTGPWTAAPRWQCLQNGVPHLRQRIVNIFGPRQRQRPRTTTAKTADEGREAAQAGTEPTTRPRSGRRRRRPARFLVADALALPANFARTCSPVEAQVHDRVVSLVVLPEGS